MLFEPDRSVMYVKAHFDVYFETEIEVTERMEELEMPVDE